MKKTISSNELHGMIAKCVGEVLAESRQKQTPRNTQKRVLTESQLQSYIQNVINEEMEKEGLGNWMKGAASYVGGKVKDKVQNFGQNVKNTLGNINQAGNNASFVADTQKLAQEVEQIFQKYGNNLSKWHRACLQNASKALNSLVQSCQNGEMNA